SRRPAPPATAACPCRATRSRPAARRPMPARAAARSWSYWRRPTRAPPPWRVTRWAASSSGRRATSNVPAPCCQNASHDPPISPIVGRRGGGPMSQKTKEVAKPVAKPTIRVRHLPSIKPGKYADGLPYDEIRYLECKLILKPNHFTSRQSLFDFAKVLRRPAKATGVIFDPVTFTERPLAIREVLFVDTHDYRLYNNAFILRRRIPYRDGFPGGDPEIVFKYRHPELQKAAEMDVRPRISTDYRIKFKAEALPLKDGLGGLRMLYSHNVEFHLSSMPHNERLSMDNIVRILPALE